MITEWQIGDKIENRWEIHNIHQGGMGNIYIVYDHQWDTVFAAKTFQDQYLVWREMRRRFVREAYIWINLDIHPHIVRAAIVESIGNKPFLFLEYVPGVNLSRWIGTSRLDLKQTLKFAIQFCYGIEHAYSKGIKVHRDIKPKNCLITKNAILKITDFGLAKVFDDIPIDKIEIGDFNPQQLGIGYSSTGKVAGTPTYMAPEQFDDAKNVNFHADIYSFGVMLYEMVVGEPPFQGKSWKDLERAHKTQSMPSLPRGTKSLEWIIERCLRKEPKDRYSSFEALREDLLKLYETITCEAASVPISGRKLGAVDWVIKGVSFGHLGFYNEMITCCNKALELDPQLKIGWSIKGVAHSALGLHEEAITFYNQALEIDPLYTFALVNKGRALFDLNRNKEALVYYDRALEIDPKNIMAWSNVIKVLKRLGRTDELLEYFDRAIAIVPESDTIWNQKGTELLILGRNEEAHICYDRAIEINPHDTISWFNKGTALLILERVEEALVCYNMALKIDPQLSHAWLNSGEALATLGYYREAIAYFERGLTEITSRSLGDKSLIKIVLDKLGSIYNRLGEHHQAIVYYEEALALARETGDRAGEGKTQGYLGKLHYDLGNIRVAIGLLEQALAIMQEVGDRQNEGIILLHLGSAYKNYGNLCRAFEYSKRSFTIAQEVGDVKQAAFASLNLALILLDQNQQSEALVNAELAVQFFKQFGNEQDVLNAQKLITQISEEIK